MLDAKRLSEWMERKNKNGSEIAEKMGITRSAFSRKRNGSRKFTAEEIATFKKIGMSQKDILSIFFAENDGKEPHSRTIRESRTIERSENGHRKT